MEAVGEPSRPRPSPRSTNIDNGKSSSNNSAASERIIPITVLGSRHNNDENDNTSVTSSMTPSPASVAKRLSAHEAPIEATTNSRCGATFQKIGRQQCAKVSRGLWGLRTLFQKCKFPHKANIYASEVLIPKKHGRGRQTHSTKAFMM